MISLVPAWARHYDAFWDAIRRRNLWFIKLRYGAVAILTALLLLARYVLGIRYSEVQITALITITLSILFYNILLHWGRRYIKSEPDKFNPLHFSLVQMVLDLYALTLLVYYTGTIESPLYMLYIFHMIIGSLMLPGFVIHTIAYATIIIFVSLTFGEYYNLIPHHSVGGLLASSFHNDIKYVAAFASIFTFVMIMSVILANRIAKQLYKMEQDLVEYVNLLDVAETEKQKHIMSVVHEIKSPISALHSYLDLILQKFLGPLDEKVEEKLQRARTRSDEAIQLINNVLQISKLRLVDEVIKEPVDIRQLVCFIISQQKINIETKKIKLSLKDEIKKEGQVKGDKLLLEIAFSNLIGNAVKYVNNNGIIEIKMIKEENKIVVTVSDNGIGIPPNEIDRIFNDFYRASNIKQKKYEGSGLGLTFVKQIIERHGGIIEVKSPSELGTVESPGCCFTVSLPLTESDIKK
jgi:signal transduction histidine kinase